MSVLGSRSGETDRRGSSPGCRASGRSRGNGSEAPEDAAQVRATRDVMVRSERAH